MPGTDDIPEFSEEWIRQGPRELSADEIRAEVRRQRSADLQRRLAADADRARRDDRRRRSSGRSGRMKVAIASIGVLAGMGVTAYALAPDVPRGAGAGGASSEGGAGFGNRRLAGDAALGGPLSRFDAGESTVPASGSTERVLPVAEILPDSGPYRFMSMRDGEDAPMTFDPCRVQYVTINRADQPAGAEGLIEDAFAELTQRTGLKFEIEADTDEPVSMDRKTYQPDRYGKRWAPIVVWWTNPAEAGVLAGAVIGAAGPAGVELTTSLGSKESAYVSGAVFLDSPQFAEALAQGDRDGLYLVVLHELGHLAGLAHVSEPGQLMYSEGSATLNGYQAGDLRGLRELGTGPCTPNL